jgi:hypothetical protein
MIAMRKTVRCELSWAAIALAGFPRNAYNSYDSNIQSSCVGTGPEMHCSCDRCCCTPLDVLNLTATDECFILNIQDSPYQPHCNGAVRPEAVQLEETGIRAEISF